jgi:hypothetical protein
MVSDLPRTYLSTARRDYDIAVLPNDKRVAVGAQQYMSARMSFHIVIVTAPVPMQHVRDAQVANLVRGFVGPRCASPV